jgi:hypothetical protein
VALVANGDMARADEPQDVEAIINRGIALRLEGRDLEALVEFERAYAMNPTPRARAQIALAHQALGAWVPAESEISRSRAGRSVRSFIAMTLRACAASQRGR